MSERRYDRAADDVGNLVEIGHLNVNVRRSASGDRLLRLRRSGSRAIRI